MSEPGSETPMTSEFNPEGKDIGRMSRRQLEEYAERTKAQQSGPEAPRPTDRPPSPEPERFGGMTFEEARTRFRKLSRRDSLSNEEETEKMRLKGVMDQYITDLQDKGELDDIDDFVDTRKRTLEVARQASVGGRFTYNQKIDYLNMLGEDSTKFALEITRSEPPSSEYPARGAKAYYLTEQLQGIENEITNLIAQESGGVIPPRSVEEGRETGRGRAVDALRLPDDLESQRNYVRNILDDIEDSNRETLDYSIAYKVTALEESMRFMHAEVAEEVRTRLSVHDSAELIRRAGGWIDDSKPYHIGAAVVEARRRRHSIERETVDVLFNNKMKGLHTKHAWDWLQYASWNPQQENMRQGEIVNHDFTGEGYKDLVVQANLKIMDQIISEREASRGRRISEREKRDILRILKGVGYDPRKLLPEPGETDPRKPFEQNPDPLAGETRDMNDVRSIRRLLSESEIRRFHDISGFNVHDDELALGKAPTNYWIDSDSARKQAVRNIIIDKLTSNVPTGASEETRRLARDNADRSLKIAEKLAMATLETSVFNQTALSGNDELAEIIGLQGWRNGRGGAGRARGPEMTINLIEGFGTSFLRMRLKDKVVYRGPTIMVKGREVRDGQLIKLEDHPIDPSKKDNPLYADFVDIDNKIYEGQHEFYGTTQVRRFNELRKLILDRQPTPEERGRFNYDLNFLQTAIIYFDTADRPANKSDKTGDKRLKLYWAMGLVDMALADTTLNWDGTAFGKLYVALVKEQLSEGKGSFLSEEQWNFIKKWTHFDSRLVKLGIKNEFEGFFDNWVRGGGGGKRR